MSRIIIYCFILFQFVMCPISAQQKVGESVTDLKNRSAILNHIDKYCKSYADKDMTFFEDNFENSLMILPDSKKISAKDYLQNLKSIFERNQDIKATVEGIKIVRHPVKQYFYGVSMIVTYDTGNYKDKGYCFWLIDLREPDRICTHIFAWQPYESTSEEERFGLEDFEIN